jgi:hypothetical protein
MHKWWRNQRCELTADRRSNTHDQPSTCSLTIATRQRAQCNIDAQQTVSSDPAAAKTVTAIDRGPVPRAE